MAGTLAPYVIPQFLTNAGAVASGYRLFTYTAGTSTKVATYQDVDLAVPHTNPIVLDSAGRPPAGIFLGSGSQKWILAATATDPPTSPTWTQDNISQVPLSAANVDIAGTAGEALAAGDVVYLSAGDGSRTAGRWYKADADNTYSSITADAIGMLPAAIASAASGTIRIAGRVTGLSGLTAGTVYYVSATAGALTSSAPANARAVGVADTTTSLVVSQWIPVLDASATQKGVVTTGTQTMAGDKTFSGAVTVSGALTASTTLGVTGLATFTVPPIGITTRATLAGDFTKNANTTLNDVPGLDFAIPANQTWEWRCILKMRSSGAASAKFTFTGPASPTGVIFGVLAAGSVSSPAASVAFGTSIVAVTLDIEEMVILEGVCRNGVNAGTIQLQFAQNASDATNSIIRAESALLARRIS